MRPARRISPRRALAAVLVAALLAGCARRSDSIAQAERAERDAPGFAETRAIAEEAYVYGFPMIAAYKAMYQLNLDRSSSQYKAPFNQIAGDARVLTPRDTAIVTPNSDTAYSMVQMDLRAEPIVLGVPAVERGRYYSVQLADMYACNYGYIGSRTTGNAAGTYMVAGPGWTGETPAGVDKVFRSETAFSLAIYRTQLFGPDDVDEVKRIQAGYTVRRLSQYLQRPAPPAPPAIFFPAFGEGAFETDFPAYLDFLLRFCPAVPEETALRARFARIGIGPGKTFDWTDLSPKHKAEIALGAKGGIQKIRQRRDTIGKDENGWRVGSAFGNRDFYHGDLLLRAAAAMAGLYGNDAEEALYPLAVRDADGEPLDGRAYRYTLTFPAGGYPPVNAFWSVTMYDGRTQLLIENPIHRYLVNSSMLPQLEKNADGSLTIYVQHDPPDASRRANWLPAPDGPIYLAMRLYWPKPEALDGRWQPPGLLRAGPR